MWSSVKAFGWCGGSCMSIGLPQSQQTASSGCCWSLRRWWATCFFHRQSAGCRVMLVLSLLVLFLVGCWLFGVVCAGYLPICHLARNRAKL